LIERLLHRLNAETALNVCQIGLPYAAGNVPVTALSRFCIESFKQGGMALVGYLLLNSRELGIALLSKGSARAAFLLCANDIVNCRVFLRLIQVSLMTLEKTKMAHAFGISVIRLGFHVLRDFGSDVQRGHSIITLCVQLFLHVKGIIGDAAFRKEYEKIEEKGKILSVMRVQITKAALRAKNVNLVTISSRERSKRRDDEEWGDLEIGD
jgi:hypothetical protein